MSELRFDGRVCVVTGAGGGLGRAYALLFGSRGAKVVVNDLGGSMDGSKDASATPAAKVVKEIQDLGGEAVANFDSVEFGEKIIKTALDTYGRVDIVINNAGILRDKSFVKMDEKDWNLINSVHLKGSYSVSHAAWEVMRNQGYGRIVMTTSAAGIYGNAGQTNYSAAKLGILGLANTLAIEGASKNVFVNTIAPVAGTRLTATIMPPDLVEALKPEFVAPLVAYLSHESCQSNSGLFEVGAGWIAALRRERTKGATFPLSRDLLPEDIRAKWNQITDFTDADHPTSPQEAFSTIMEQLNKEHPRSAPPHQDLRFDGKVVVVTGAGGGLGRTYALMFAARGAKVVVNDLGGGIKGDDGQVSHKPAEIVVNEIKKLGGEAVANFDSVEFGEKIIKTALDAYGRVDIVINNAGILRDRSFAKMQDADFDLIYKVHMTGSYSVSHAAWEVMRQQNFGRIIMTSSAAGIYGNHGQANYSAAKLGILGLANSLAIEGERRNIFTNTIAPVAGTRMTETVMPANLVEALKTEYVAPLVLYLCHESTNVNGQLFEVGAGWVSTLRWERTEGVLLPVSPAFTVEDVSKHWDRITDFSRNTTHPASAQDSITTIISALENAKSTKSAAKQDGNEHVKPSSVLGFKFSPISVSYNAKDVSLYALSVGAAQQPTDDDELAFVYENHERFQALPTLGIIFPFPVLAQLISDVPDLNFNPMMLLHGEQSLEIRSPLPTEGTITSSGYISGLYDKGKGVTVVIDSLSKDQHGNEICFNQFTVFIRGIGGYGGDRGPAPETHSPPANTKPHATQIERTADNQALLYRLASGDLNPLHADPQMAAMGRFDKPILHGMCTYGYAGRAILKHFCHNDPKLFKGIKARMTKHVFPGETLKTEMWKVSDTQVVFQVTAVERNEVVLGNAVATIQSAAQGTNATASSSASNQSAFKSDPLFALLKEKIAQNGPELVKKVNGVFLFKITEGANGATQTWAIDLKSGSGSVSNTAPEKADLTITVTDSDCVDLFNNKLNPQTAFMQGKLKVAGNMAFAMKLDPILKAEKAKL